MNRDNGNDDQELAEGQEESMDDQTYEEAVIRHAKYLGINPEKDAAYFWIAEEVRSFQPDRTVVV